MESVTVNTHSLVEIRNRIDVSLRLLLCLLGCLVPGLFAPTTPPSPYSYSKQTFQLKTTNNGVSKQYHFSPVFSLLEDLAFAHHSMPSLLIPFMSVSNSNEA